MKKEEIIISTAKTNTDKYNTYTSMITRHKEAVKHGFCFEALLIDYAILEDRLVAFLWAAGVMNDMDNFSFGNKNNKAQLRTLYNSYMKEDKIPRLQNIGTKINVILSLIDFSQKEYNGADRYLLALHKGMNDLNLQKISENLTLLKDWLKYRNEVIHGAMTKDIYALYENIEEKAVQGLAYARVIDNEAKKLMRRDYIRKAVKMPIKK